MAELGPAVRFCPGDLTEPGSPAGLVEHAREAFGRLDVLVDNWRRAGYASTPSRPGRPPRRSTTPGSPTSPTRRRPPAPRSRAFRKGGWHARRTWRPRSPSSPATTPRTTIAVDGGYTAA
jgi:hypothetical protein